MAVVGTETVQLENSMGPAVPLQADTVGKSPHYETVQWVEDRTECEPKSDILA